MPRVAVNGIEMEYEILGDRGQPLLLIMGLAAQLIHWPEALCRQFVERGFQVIRFDNRDAGLSTQIETTGTKSVWSQLGRALIGLSVDAPYTLSDMADDTAGLLEAIGIERAHVCGVSLGGMIAQTLAIRHPARVLSLTSIMSTPGGRRFGLPSIRAIRALLGPRPKTREQAADGFVHFFQICGSPGFFRDEKRVRDIALRSFDRGMSSSGLRRQFLAVLASGSRYQQLSHLDVPALVIHGNEDPLIRLRAGRATAKAINGARFKLISGMGHDLADGMWPLLVENVCELVTDAGFSLESPVGLSRQSV